MLTVHKGADMLNPREDACPGLLEMKYPKVIKDDSCLVNHTIIQNLPFPSELNMKIM